MEGVDVWVAAATGQKARFGGQSNHSATLARLGGLGAEVHQLEVDPLGTQPVVDAEQLHGARLPVVTWDAESAMGDRSDVTGVHAALDGAWLATRAVATAVMHPGDRGGKVILLAPWPGDAHRAAARAGLENLSRTLGIEWARFGVRTVTLLPGPETDAAALAELVGYLASPAGDYFSGTAITLT